MLRKMLGNIMNNCINLKQKLNKKLYCKYKKCDIKISECSNCIYKEYKKSGFLKKSPVFKQKSNKLANLERKRKSILTKDLDHCIVCDSKKEHLHEIYFGKNRLNSIKYGLVIPVCFSCHTRIHNDIDLDLFYKKKGQVVFNKTYPDLDFVSIFKKNYI